MLRPWLSPSSNSHPARTAHVPRPLLRSPRTRCAPRLRSSRTKAAMPITLVAELVTLAKSIATEHELDPVLVCAVCEQESAWNTFAIRYEPLFMVKYVAPLYTNHKVSASEAYARAFSWGLMQVMGQVAREQGFDALYLRSEERR